MIWHYGEEYKGVVLRSIQASKFGHYYVPGLVHESFMLEAQGLEPGSGYNFRLRMWRGGGF